MAGNSETSFRTTANKAISLRFVVGRRSLAVGATATKDGRLMTVATATSPALVPISPRGTPSAEQRLRRGSLGPAIHRLLPEWRRIPPSFRLGARLQPFVAPDLGLPLRSRFSRSRYAAQLGDEAPRPPAPARAFPPLQQSCVLQALLPTRRP